MKKSANESRATYHCCGRIEERAGITGDAAVRFALNAALHGKAAADFDCGRERKYLDAKSCESTVALAYNGFCFIVKCDTMTCITMYQLPEWFGKKRFYDGKERIRNVNKYYRNHGYDNYRQCA